jgi:hypothetical protein
MNPVVVTLHKTLDAIEEMLASDTPICDFAEVGREFAAVSDRNHGLRVSIGEMMGHRNDRRRSKRPSAK